MPEPPSPPVVPFSRPELGEEEIAEVVDTLRSGWLTTGHKTRRFEESFARLIGAPAALALGSCTSALYLALLAADIGDGDEVITTGLTFAATANVIVAVGARPVLVDVEADTLNIDPRAIERAITPRTRAIIPVHYAGHACDLTAIDGLSRAHSLVVVEDAAHAIGARYRDEPIGSHPDRLAAFSFYANKNITTGEGGMLVGPPPLVDRARIMSRHGIDRDAWARRGASRPAYYEVVYPGLKHNMTDIAASLGLHQIARLDGIQRRRRAVAERYSHAFAGVPALEIPTVRPEVHHAWHLYPLRLRLDRLGIDRDRFAAELLERGVSTSVHFVPLQLHPWYRDHGPFEPAPVTMREHLRCLSLPLFAGMTDAQVNRVVEVVLDVAAENER